MSKINEIKILMQEHGMRVTQSRLAVATVLIKNSSSLLTPEEIFNKIQASKTLKCDQVSVYRTLTAFEEMGIIKKSSFQGEATRYSLLAPEAGKSHGHKHHEHFFKCIKCNLIESFEDCLVSKKEKELEASGYTSLKHHLEITGLCPRCTNA